MWEEEKVDPRLGKSPIWCYKSILTFLQYLLGVSTVFPNVYVLKCLNPVPAPSASIHLGSYNCKNDSLSHQLKSLFFADSTVPWLSLCITHISHSCSIFKSTGMKNVTCEVWNFEKQAVGFGECGLCGGASPPHAAPCRPVFNCRTFPQLAYTPAQLCPPPPRLPWV